PIRWRAAGTSRSRIRSDDVRGALPVQCVDLPVARGLASAAMVRPAPSEFDEETIPVPRTVRFPVELVPPDGFDPVRLETWPRVAGRLEWVGGRLLYMPPCARLQWVTVADLVTTLGNWGRRHPEFEVGTNEAGMALAGAVRAADAAVWRRAGLGADSGFARVPPRAGRRGGGPRRVGGRAAREGPL